MRTLRFVSVCLCLFAAAALASGAGQAQTQPPASDQAPAAFDPSRSDEKAIAVADQVMATMGQEAWKKTRFIKFTWVWQQGEKSTGITHYWDRVEHRSRMEGPSKDGRPVIAVVDMKTKQGSASIDGQPLVGAEADKYVDIAYTRQINDAYWFFMPFELESPGVRLRYEGEIKAGPVTYDKIQITFDGGVKQSLGDRFWLYVNRDTQLIERWSYLMPGQGINTSPIAWQWVDWVDVDGLKLATRRTQPGGESDVVMENPQVFESLPETVFTKAEPYEAPAAMAGTQ